MLLVMALLAAQAQDSAKGATALKPLTDPASWVSEDDYPPVAARAGEQGIVAFRLEVDSNGNPTSCGIVDAAASGELQQQTCALLLKRARFRPARDARGRSIAASYTSRVRWKLPEDHPSQAPIAIGNWKATATVRQSAEGKVLSCDMQAEGAVPFSRENDCDSVPSGLLARVGGAGTAQTVTVRLAMTFDGAPEPFRDYPGPGQLPSARMRFTFEVSESGTTENCKVVPTGEEGWMASLPSPCQGFADTYIPAKDENGKPRRVAGVFMMSFSRRPAE